MKIGFGGAVALAAAVALLGGVGDAQAQRRGVGGMDMSAKHPYEFFEKKGLFPTGLKPVFPAGLDCPGISSPFGSKTRHDGTHRVNPFHGYHNGMDITLDVGTPLLAVADGEVIHKGSAGMLVGNFIWLRFPPEATGLPVHVFARYQHLDAPSPLNVGDRVTAGQTVGPAGKTGTVGGNYGDFGYPHLHLAVQIGEGPGYEIKEAALSQEGHNYLDPMGLYVPRPVAALDNHRLRDLPADAKTVSVPVKTADGRVFPEGSKMVWPVACRAK